MNIKKKMSKFISLLLSFVMTFSSVIPAYAMEITNSDSETVIDGENIGAEESNFEDIKVTYKQSSSFFVTIPKTIALDGWKQSTYTVKVSGDIDAEQCVYVAPVDGISETEDIDFYMEDQASKNRKADVVATVTQNKQHWNSAEVADGYAQTDNLVNAPDLTAGTWKGVFQMEIKLESHVTHTHNYVEAVTKEATCIEKGERKFTCVCGDSYTEEIPAKGHHYENGECTDCGEKDPSHTHSYTETITKEPTCTEKGEKTYICDCGDSYTEEIPAKGHHYENHICTECGELNPDHTHSYDEGVVTKEPTCTEKGEKTFTCSGCGHSYVEEIDATGHHYGDDDKCTGCGELNPDHTHSYTNGACSICGGKCSHDYINGTCTICGKTVGQYYTAPTSAYSNWNYTLDDENNIITLNYYIGSETNVTVYANYVINGKTYKTQLASNTEDAAYNTPYMFNGYAQTNCQNIKTIKFSEDIDTSNVANMSYMFYYCKSLTSLDVSNFDTKNVTDMSCMFCMGYSSNSLLASLNLSSFDTSNVTDMKYMFNGCQSLTSLDVSNFDTSKVTNMNGMFEYCLRLTSLDLSKWDTSNVTDMGSMFNMFDNNLDSSLTYLNVSNFDTSNVANMSAMFEYCESLTSLDVSNFDTSNVTNMSSMFYGCYALTSLDVSNFDTNNVESTSFMFDSCYVLTSLDLSGWNTSKVTDMQSMFNYCKTLTSLDLSSFDTSNVTNMSQMFNSCESLISLDLSSFDTSNVTDMFWMFMNCSSLTSLDLSNFDTRSVTRMASMFSGCKSLTSLDVSSFDTSEVTSLQFMFNKCESLTSLNVSSFDTSSATDMWGMFMNCSSLTSLDLSNFDTRNVTNMMNMFYDCSKLKTIYASSSKWSTSKATTTNMFSGCGTSSVTYK